MRAAVWQQDQSTEPPPWPWRTVRTLAVDIADPIIRLAKIPGAFIPGVNKALDSASDFTAMFAADLNISPLDGLVTSKPFDGVPPPVTTKTGDGPVFFDGVETTITVSHNGKGKEQILLERIDLHVSEYFPGPNPYYSYKRDGEAVIGAGFIEPMRMYVEVGAKGAHRARRQIVRDNGKKDMIVAQSDNFLDTDPAGFYLFATNDAPIIIKTTLTALDAGYYKTCLRFFYRVAGRELRQYTSDPVHLYSDGP